MEQFLEFAVNNWMLVTALLALFALLAWDSSHKAGPKVSTHEATRLINQNNAIVLDIREKADFKAGHVVDSINIPNAQVTNRIEELGKHKSDPIIVKPLKTMGLNKYFALVAALWNGPIAIYPWSKNNN